MVFKTFILSSLIIAALPSATDPIRAGSSLQPVTLCEVLENHKSYNGKLIAVIGRFRSTDEGFWLGDPDCGLKLETDHLKWPNNLWLEYSPLSPPLSQTNKVDLEAARKKIDALRQRTELLKSQDEWVVVIGRLEFPDQLQTFAVGGRRRIAGFGHLASSPGQLVYRQGDIKDLD